MKEEAERQILQRSELDMEEESVRSSDNVWNLTETGHFDLSRLDSQAFFSEFLVLKAAGYGEFFFLPGILRKN